MPQNPQDINIRSEEVQEILSKVPNWMIRYGNTLIFVLIVMLLFISWFIKYPDVISAEVMVTTTIPPEKIYAKTSGQFQAILTHDGKKVYSNQVLAIIENSGYYKDILYLKNIVDTIALKEHSLNFTFPIEKLPPLILGTISTSFAQFENDYYEYLLNKELTPLASESIANQTALLETKKRFGIQTYQLQTNRKELTYKEHDLERSKKLFEQGVISKKELENKQIEILQAKRTYKSLEASLSQTIEAIKNSNRNLRGTYIKTAQTNTRLLKKAIQSFLYLKKAIKDWKKNYTLTSSINGKISFLSFWNKNQTVQNGDLVFTVVPNKKEDFIGKIKAPISNSGKIKIGQKVQIKLLNYPPDEFGKLNGIIKSISLIPDQKGNYLIDVKLPKTLITTYGKEIDFKQEMTGSADIITEDLRLIQRFFYQLKNILK